MTDTATIDPTTVLTVTAVAAERVRKLLATQDEVKGSELDWVEEKLASRFVFNNPNVVGACGCGESFKIAEQD